MQIHITQLNGHKIPAKENQVVDRRDADEISVSKTLFLKYSEYVPLILHNYKKLNSKKILRFKTSSFLSAQCLLVTAAL